MKLAMILFAILSMTSAFSLDKPKGKVILSITGKIKNKNNGDSADFDMAMLEKLKKAEVVTTTPWHQGKQSFLGVSFLALKEAVGFEGQTLEVRALNDYKSEIPMSDVYNPNMILAYKNNNKYMEIKDKGPLFIIYPYDQGEKFQNEVYYNRSVWQLRKILVK